MEGKVLEDTRELPSREAATSGAGRPRGGTGRSHMVASTEIFFTAVSNPKKYNYLLQNVKRMTVVQIYGKIRKSTSSKSSGGFLGSRKILRWWPFTLNNVPLSF